MIHLLDVCTVPVSRSGRDEEDREEGHGQRRCIEKIHLIIYKIETKNLGRLGLEHGSRGLSCGVLTIETVGGICKEGKSYTT